MKTALLLSGGMDSNAVAWWTKPDVAYTVDYGQLAAQAEIQASAAICHRLKIPHEVLTIDARPFGSGDMAGTQADERAPAKDWWPYRNQLLITLVAMRAMTINVKCLLLGTVASDVAHKDGTAKFITNISRLLSHQEGEMLVKAPAIEMTTAQLVKVSDIPRAALLWSHSCHKADVPCGQCRGCNKYFDVLKELDYYVGAAR